MPFCSLTLFDEWCLYQHLPGGSGVEPPINICFVLGSIQRKRLVRTVLIFTESSDQLSRATDRVPGLPASPGYVQ
ncbi:TPA: hypothetical protein HND20_25610 [Escherichia coli]|nr:hypothetical protein [Escherichia coli]